MVVTNSYAGEYPVKIGDSYFVLVYDWSALAKVQAVYSKIKIAELFTDFNPDILAGLMEIGLYKHHPEWTAEKIKEASPAYMPCVIAVDKAFACAYFGTDTAPEEKKTLARKIMEKISLKKI